MWIICVVIYSSAAISWAFVCIDSLTPGAHPTNDNWIEFESLWNFVMLFLHHTIGWSKRSFAHVTTITLSWRVQKVIVISWANQGTPIFYQISKSIEIPLVGHAPVCLFMVINNPCGHTTMTSAFTKSISPCAGTCTTIDLGQYPTLCLSISHVRLKYNMSNSNWLIVGSICFC